MKVFIIAGVGDHTKYIEHRTRDWEVKYGLEPHVLKFGWKGDYSDNYSILKNKVKALSNNEKTTIVGISAGGSAAIRIASELDNVKNAITICGRTSRGGFKLVSLKSFPAYWKSVDMLSGIRFDKELLVIKPLFDEIVSVNHMNFKNTKVLTVPYLLHIPSILGILAKKSNAIAEFAKN